MICRICNNRFYIKREFVSLFSTKKYIICDPCYKKYPIDLEYEAVKLEEYECCILNMFSKKYRINTNAFIYEYSKIFNKFYRKNNYFVLMYESLDLNDYYVIEALDIISKLLQKNLFIITFFLKK